jgi:Ricin-type beta-trefoil lectin domain-like
MRLKSVLAAFATGIAALSLAAEPAQAATWYPIKNVDSSLCAGVGSSDSNGHHVIQYYCNGASDENWTFVSTETSNGFSAYYIKDYFSAKCIGVGSSKSSGAPTIQYTCNGSEDEKWQPWYNDAHTAFALHNAYSDLCIGTGGDTAAGIVIYQYGCAYYSSHPDLMWKYPVNL